MEGQNRILTSESVERCIEMRNRIALSLASGVVGFLIATALGIQAMPSVPWEPDVDAPEAAKDLRFLELQVTMTGFDPWWLRADPGVVTITVENATEVDQTCSLGGVEELEPISPGKTGTLKVWLEAGTYEFACDASSQPEESTKTILLAGPPRIGAHVNSSQLGVSSPIEAVHEREEQVGGAYGLHRLYFRWNDTLPSPSLIQTLEEGRTALVSWNSLGSRLSWAQVASGSGDDQIREVGQALAPLDELYPGKIFFAWHHEPEVTVRWAKRTGAIETGTGAEFAAGWQRVFRIFAEEGFTPVRALVSDEYNPEFTDGVQFDVLAPDNYPWSPLTPNERCNPRWESFEEVWRGMRSMFASRFPDKAVLIGETGAQEKRHPRCQPWGDVHAKGRWFREAIPVIEEWADDATNPLIGVGIFDSGWFRVDTSPLAMREWAKLVGALQPPPAGPVPEGLPTPDL
jgi:hypothetical protein